MSAVLAIDQGTSGTKALLLDQDGTVLDTATQPVGQQAPAPGRVEQDPDAVWESVTGVVRTLMSRRGEHVAAVALSTQRESVLAWDAITGHALSPLLSWQDRRTAQRCDQLAAGPVAKEITSRSGLPVDPMFSATKIAWLLDHGEVTSRTSQLRVGTLDGWLVCKLGGDDVCEIGNASRTQLLDLDTATWSPDLLELFGVPGAVLPRVVPSTGPFGTVSNLPGVAAGTPIAAVLGDSHAALYAQSGGRRGEVKATYGSGSSLMAVGDTGAEPPVGLSRTVAWQVTDTPTYALEANIVAAGAAVQWVRNLLGLDHDHLHELITHAPEIDDLVLVPAFNGLGAPYWDRDARAVLVGATLATTGAELARAAVESIGFQINDTLALFDEALGPVRELRADGGASSNDQLMQFQADLCGRPVIRAGCTTTSALGAAYLAGTRLGFFETTEIADSATTTFLPQRDRAWRSRRLAQWRDGLDRSRR